MKNNYIKLESKMVKYRDLINIPVVENNEPFVIVPQNKIPNKYLPDMKDIVNVFGKKMIVRKSIYRKLISAQKQLQEKYPEYSLFLTYGYRSLEVQTERFMKRLKDVSSPSYSDSTELYEAVHRSIAVPTVAGHPTGGAIDIAIINLQSNQFLDFGTKQYDYRTKDYYVFSPFVSLSAKANRKLLRSVMVNAGFAPFDGEWWHFSYGDREWTYYYKKNNAIFEQKTLREVTKLL